jgi:predicted transcriptional regulator of viral defense system
MNVNKNRLSVADMVLEKARINNGIITSAMLTEAGISRGHLSSLVKSGKLTRAARGIYTLPWIFDDDYFNLQTRYSKGIFSGTTALFLFNLTDRTPERPEMTFPLRYNVSALKNQNVVCKRTKLPWYELGITAVRTPGGNTVCSYNIERTLCELLRRGGNADIQIVTDAFKRYVKLKDKDVHRLSEYAKTMRVEEKTRSYMEVLL